MPSILKIGAASPSCNFTFLKKSSGVSLIKSIQKSLLINTSPQFDKINNCEIIYKLMHSESNPLIKQIVSEFLGTFLIIFFCTVSVQEILNAQQSKLTEAILLEHGLCSFFMVASCSWIFYTISGSHFHSGITLGALFLGKLNIN